MGNSQKLRLLKKQYTPQFPFQVTIQANLRNTILTKSGLIHQVFKSKLLFVGGK